MKLATSLILISSASQASAWISSSAGTRTTQLSKTTALKGYLDNLSKELYEPESDFDRPEDIVRERTQAKEEDTDRFGVGKWDSYVEFNEFDGGDGQMGVAGDGKQGLEKEWKGAAQMGKSKMMSAKNAWGSTTGYAEELKEKGMEATRAQQMENWMNQQEVIAARKQQRYMTDEFDSLKGDEDWRALGNKFGVERNQDFDLDETLGAVVPGPVLQTIELQSRVNRNEVYDFELKNNFMGYSDFRARFTPDNVDWKVEPAEGSISGKQSTPFVVKYRPNNPGVSETYLVIDTEDDKWTYKFIGTGSM